MPSNYTPNYNLNQWEPEDKVLRTDFNADNAKIDAVLGTLSQTVAGHTTMLSKKGNCRIQTLFYTGTGEYGAEHPNTLTFSGKPTCFLGFGGQAVLFYTKDCKYIVSLHNGGYNYQTRGLTTTWNGNTASWYGNDITAQANEKTTYFIVAFYVEG